MLLLLVLLVLLLFVFEYGVIFLLLLLWPSTSAADNNGETIADDDDEDDDDDAIADGDASTSWTFSCASSCCLFSIWPCLSTNATVVFDGWGSTFAATGTTTGACGECGECDACSTGGTSGTRCDGSWSISSVTKASKAAKSSHKWDKERSFEISRGLQGKLQIGHELKVLKCSTIQDKQNACEHNNVCGSSNIWVLCWEMKKNWNKEKS